MAEEGADTKEALVSRPRTTVPILMLIFSSLPCAEKTIFRCSSLFHRKFLVVS